MITVAQLIQQLQKHDPQLPVVLSGYEGGVYCGPSNATPVTIALNINDPEDWWYGPHEIVHEGFQEYDGAEKITAIYLR
jgi:hypothetical protein